MLNKKIIFIGPGVMAEAMIAGLLRKKLAKPENILGVDIAQFWPIGLTMFGDDEKSVIKDR